MRDARTNIVSTLLAVLAGLGFALLAAFLWRTAGAANTSQYGTTFNPPSYSSPASPAAATSPSPATSSPAPQPSPTASIEPEDGSDDGGGDG